MLLHSPTTRRGGGPPGFAFVPIDEETISMECQLFFGKWRYLLAYRNVQMYSTFFSIFTTYESLKPDASITSDVLSR